MAIIQNLFVSWVSGKKETTETQANLACGAFVSTRSSCNTSLSGGKGSGTLEAAGASSDQSASAGPPSHEEKINREQTGKKG